MSRLAIFVDYLDFCSAAEETFGPFDGDHAVVRLDLVRLTELLAAGNPGGEHATEVRVYRGVPHGRRDEAGFAAALRQMAGWREQGVVVVRRPLDEPCDGGRRGGTSRALSVALAIDLLAKAWTDEFDTALLCSRDRALEPAVRGVLGHTWRGVVVAAWRDPHRPTTRLRVRGEDLPCAWLDRRAFEAVLEGADTGDSEATCRHPGPDAPRRRAPAATAGVEA